MDIKIGMENYCELCNNMNTCIKYMGDYVCLKCKDEYGFKSDIEEEIYNREWWRNHFNERIGRILTENEFTDLYIKIKNDL